MFSFSYLILLSVSMTVSSDQIYCHSGKLWRNLPQLLFVEYVKNTVRKVMLSAVSGEGEQEKLALQAAPARSSAMVA
ncbi:hypothetical protein [Klebsiella quasivariicola]|uniref:hypothetical protein n=1 Tax=Klebsiella quasivariicola TaxID=2026240 RepID=UPI002479216F|nr:hypothetical protein [Klebsiella quasivariicola]